MGSGGDSSSINYNNCNKEMNEIMKEKCRAYFKAANKAECVYVAGDKLFIDEGAARSYGEVEKVKRTDVMATEPIGPEGAKNGAEPKGKEEKLNDKGEE